MINSNNRVIYRKFNIELFTLSFKGLVAGGASYPSLTAGRRVRTRMEARRGEGKVRGRQRSFLFWRAPTRRSLSIAPKRDFNRQIFILFGDFPDFLWRLQPSKTTTRKTLNSPGVEKSSSPRRVLHF